jgi:ribosomal protein S4
MHVINKYKIFSKTKTIKQFFPFKILKFKKTKWVRVKKNYLKMLKRRKFSNYEKIKIRFSSFKKKRRLFKDALKTKQLMYQIFKDSLNFKLFKKWIIATANKGNLKSSVWRLLFLKIEYKIDIVLWRLYFFSSILEARKAIKQGDVFVNNIKISQNYFLKQGDIIQVFKKSDKQIRAVLAETKKTSSFYSFFEIDYYTRVFIVLKDYKQLSYLDSTLCLYEPNSILQIYRIITKE